MIRVRRITMDDPLYAQEVDLRTRVLLSAVGWTIQDYLDEEPGREEACEHYVAVADHPEGERVVGVAMLQLPEGEGAQARGKVVQVAVDRQLQSQGIGRRVMVAIEARAFAGPDAGGLGLRGLYCHAQITAISFYERLGWRSESDLFLEAGIEHRVMGIASPEHPPA